MDMEKVDPPARCHRGQCLHEDGHKGQCLFDDGTAKYHEQRDGWRKRAIKMMEARAGKVGKPSKLSRELTVGEIGEHCGVSRQTLYNWWNRHAPKKKKQRLDAEQATHKNQQKAITTFAKAAEWVAKAAAPDTMKYIKDNPEALTRAWEQKQSAIATLETLQFPPLPAGKPTIEAVQGKLEASADRLARLADIALQEATTLRTLLTKYKGQDVRFLSTLGAIVQGARERFEKALDALGDERVKLLPEHAAAHVH